MRVEGRWTSEPSSTAIFGPRGRRPASGERRSISGSRPGQSAALLDDLPTRQPGDFVGIVAGDPRRQPGADNGHQGSGSDPAFLVAVDRIDRQDRRLRLTPVSSASSRIAPSDGLAELERRPGNPQRPDIGGFARRTTSTRSSLSPPPGPRRSGARVTAGLSPRRLPRQLRACRPELIPPPSAAPAGFPVFQRGWPLIDKAPAP
jgi:hypothetical protein